MGTDASNQERNEGCCHRCACPAVLSSGHCRVICLLSPSEYVLTSVMLCLSAPPVFLQINRWFHYDDSRVHALSSIETVARLCQRDGYLFFYVNDAIGDQ